LADTKEPAASSEDGGTDLDHKAGPGAANIEEAGFGPSAAAAPSHTERVGDIQAAAGKASQMEQTNRLFLQFACWSGRHLGEAWSVGSLFDGLAKAAIAADKAEHTAAAADEHKDDAIAKEGTIPKESPTKALAAKEPTSEE